MSRELLTYKDIESTRTQLEQEEISKSHWEELSKLDDSSLIAEFKRDYARIEDLEIREEKLNQLANRYSPLCRYVSPTFSRIKNLALRNLKECIKVTNRYHMAFKIAENRGISTSSLI